jgi:thiosulfate dehydrogenase (quinone) large subunit
MKINSVPSPSHLHTLSPASLTQGLWRQKGIGVLRILFGLVWSIDAWFKWQSDFQNNFVNYLSKALDGQPAAIQAWITFWISVVKINPFCFSHLLALGETALAIGLIFGLFSNLTNTLGMLMSLLIWSTAEGFGGPYVPGTTDIGTAIIYALVFVVLFLNASGLSLGLDRHLTPLLGRFRFLASGSLKDSHSV